MKTRKKLAAALAGLMTIAALAGCSNATTSAQNHGKEATHIYPRQTEHFGGDCVYMNGLGRSVCADVTISVDNGEGGTIDDSPTVEVSGATGSMKDDSIPTYAEWARTFDPKHPVSAKDMQNIYLKTITNLSDSQIKKVTKAEICLAPSTNGSYSAVIALIQKGSVADTSVLSGATRSAKCVPISLNVDNNDNLFVLTHAVNKYTDALSAPLSLTVNSDGFAFASLKDDTYKTQDFTWDIDSVKFIAL